MMDQLDAYHHDVAGYASMCCQSRISGYQRRQWTTLGKTTGHVIGLGGAPNMTQLYGKLCKRLLHLIAQNSSSCLFHVYK